MTVVVEIWDLVLHLRCRGQSNSILKPSRTARCPGEGDGRTRRPWYGSPVIALTLRTVEFLFYHLLLSVVDRVSRLPRDSTTMPEAIRLYRENVALKAQIDALERHIVTTAGTRCTSSALLTNPRTVSGRSTSCARAVARNWMNASSSGSSERLARPRVIRASCEVSSSHPSRHRRRQSTASRPSYPPKVDLTWPPSATADDHAAVDLETGAGWITIWTALKGERGTVRWRPLGTPA